MNVFRRSFLQSITAAGTGGLTLGKSNQSKSVTYRIKGFTCVTCAVGLEVMLSRQAGVRHAQASYPKANVQIEFDPSVVSEKVLQGFIADTGFSVVAEER